MMRAQELLQNLEHMGIKVITGVPDSTLKAFCDGLQLHGENFRHYVAVNEGAAVGIAMGSYLASGKPACVYLQNSGIGNIVNPLTSLANSEIYGIPMLFIIGWRGEPGVKDEPQHVFMGKITCRMMETLEVPYAVIDKNTTSEKLQEILEEADQHLKKQEQFAIIVKKGTFDSDEKFVWDNGCSLGREQALGSLLELLPENACIVSTTGKISRELYEQSNRRKGSHENLFMTVGGMGHASMIAYGIAQENPGRRVICVDGDGAVLMHMGTLPFIASKASENFVHVVMNNRAHESVGAMPTDCGSVSLSEMAKAAGYKKVSRVQNENELKQAAELLRESEGPVFLEIQVSLGSRADLGRPAETARENRDDFMDYLKKQK